jgi:murein hydrolase activator
LIQSWQTDLAVLSDTEAKLATETARQAATRQQLDRERAALQESTRARRQLLGSWDAELKSQDARLAQLLEDEQRLKALVQSLANPLPDAAAPVAPTVLPPAEAARTARCPPAGNVLARFGEARMSGRWDGMLIGGKEGAPVRAVAPGQVAFADWFRGYGLLMIVDHGDGIMSLYAFNQTLYKNKGDSIHADDLIAALGASGGRDQPGLYFGIREQGRPVDPLTWCASRN